MVAQSGEGGTCQNQRSAELSLIMSGSKRPLSQQCQRRLANPNDAREVLGVKMQPGFMDLQPQDVVLVGVILRLSHCCGDLLDRRPPLSEEDQAEQRQGVGSVIFDSQIGIGPGLERVRAEFEREPARLSVFSG
jgi:hypothetical protein